MNPRYVQSFKQPRDVLGKKLCKVCSKQLPKRRSSYCSDECWLRNTPSMIRSAVARRDKAICTLCQIQCRSSEIARYGYGTAEYELNRKRPNWQADHIVPVAEGGGLCGLEGYRTLCSKCHGKSSGELRKRLNQKRSEHP